MKSTNIIGRNWAMNKKIRLIRGAHAVSWTRQIPRLHLMKTACVTTAEILIKHNAVLEGFGEPLR